MPWPTSRVYYGWIIVLVLGVTGAISFGSTQYLFSILLAPMQRDLGWSRGVLSGAYSLSLVGAALLAVPAGRLADAHGPRALTSVGSLATGASLMLLAFCSQLWQLYVLWAGGIGLGMALTLYPIAFTAVTNWFDRRRASALTLLTMLSGGLSTPVFLPAAGLLIAHVDWRETVLLLGALQLGVALPLRALLLRRRPEDHGLALDGDAERRRDRAASPAAGMTRAQAMATSSFWLLTLSGAAGLLSDTLITSQQVAYLLDQGVSAVLAATVAGAVGVSALPSRLVLSGLADRVSSRTALALGLVAQAAGATLLLGVALWGLWAVWGYVAVYGASRAAVVPLRAAVLADQFGRREYGLITAWQGMVVSVAGAAGPVVAGMTRDRLGSYVPALLLATACLALASAAVRATAGKTSSMAGMGSARLD